MKTYGTITWFKGAWVIAAEPHVVIRLRRVFPRVARKEDFIGMADTVETARELEWFLSRYPLKYVDGPKDANAVGMPAAQVEGRLSERARQHRDGESLVDKMLKGIQPATNFRLALPPRDYQKLAASLVLQTGGLLVADEMGLGKTIVAICVASDPRARPALIVTLTALPPQWESEFRKFAPSLVTHVLRGTRPYDLTKACGGRFPDVILTSYSKLPGWGDTLAPLVNSMQLDECQELRRGDSTLKGAAAAHIARKVKFRAGYSGTPVFNMGGELHPVMEVIRPGALGTRSEFSLEWCTGDAENPGKLKIKNPQAMGTYLRDAGMMIRRTKQDVGRELPALTRIPHTIDSDDAELKKIEGKAVVLAQIIMSKSAQARGQQMQASSELNNLVRQATGIAKARYVAEFVRMVAETDERVIVYLWHRSCYDIIWEELSDEKKGDLHPVMFSGSESVKEKQEAKDRFCGGDARVMLMSLRSGAGLDGMQHHCRIGVFAELDWSPGVHDQCLSEDTEILTRDGFRGVNDVRLGTEVAGFEVESGAIRWVPALAKTDRRLGAGEQMFAVRSKKVDLRVTGQHRMVVRRKRRLTSGTGRSKWGIESAEDLVGQTRRAVPRCGRQGSAGVPLTDYQLRFLGWYASDGSFNGKMVTIYQAAHQPWNADIVEVLDGCGMNWKLYTRPSNGGLLNMYQVAKTGRHFWSGEELDAMSMMRSAGKSYAAIASRLGMSQDAVGKRARKLASNPDRQSVPTVQSQGRSGWAPLAAYLDKNLSPLLEEMTREQLRHFIHGVFMGDGNKSKTRKTTMRITNTNHLFLSRLQSLCVRRGMAATISTRKTRTSANRLAYDIYISDAEEAALPGHAKANRLKPCPTVPGERVWCVTNELGTLIVRRNGKVAVVGNCETRIYRDGQPFPTLFYYLLSNSGSDPIISDMLGIKRGQIEGIRDPKGAFEHGLDAEGQNVKKLAQAYLLKHGKIRA